MGFNLQGGMGAGTGAEMLQQILKQKALEFQQAEQIRMAEARMKEDARQADQSTGTTMRGQDFSREASQGNLKLGQDSLGQRTKEFDAEAPQREAGVALTGAQTGEILRKPTAEQEARDFTTGRDKTQQGYEMQQLGAQHAGQMRLQNARVAGSAAPQEGKSDAYTGERNTRVLDSVKGLMDKVTPYTTGAGSLLSYLPGTAAKNFDAELNTLKANIAFNELAEMRAASKTGGALGAVSERELALLESTLGALDTRQSPGQFKAQLAKAQAGIERWQAAKGGGGAGGKVSPQLGDTVNLQWDGEKFVKPGGGD